MLSYYKVFNKLKFVICMYQGDKGRVVKDPHLLRTYIVRMYTAVAHALPLLETCEPSTRTVPTRQIW